MKRLLSGLVLLIAPTLAMAQTIPAPSSEALLQMANGFQQELTENILPFWQKNLPNKNNNGFFGVIDAQGKPVPGSTRSALLSSEILWAFSAADAEAPSDEYKKLAAYAFADLEKNFQDKQHGGVYWMLGVDGKPIQPHKQVYAQALALLAYCEYARTHKPALEQAKVLYKLLEKYARDTKQGGYIQTLNQDWSQGKATDSFNTGAAKTLKTQLQVLQAYSRLLALWPNAELKKNHKELIALLQSKAYNSKTGHFDLDFNNDWKAQGDAISNGLDQEAAWSLVIAAKVQDEEELITHTEQFALKVAATGLKGLDGTGGLVNSPEDTNKDWWVQGEALVSFLTAYQISGDTRYLMGAMRNWGFIKAHLAHPQGDWYWGTDTAGRQRNELRANPFKGPLHNSRAMLEATYRLQLLAAVARSH
ncbi:AGE family epimerase/isomerase [Cellvibrio mixtus]|uniref:AGE family epimerase/isomerase n=1 Tax=Cellvibrio mixtus TaxID=39650 RepID=UPI0006939813|nr:AGE family epimerase/isomerase [Cellvibrio mixtus]